MAEEPLYHGSMAATTPLVSSYRVLKEGAGLLDRSESGKLALTGPQAAEVLNGQVSNEVEALEPGSGVYAALLTNKGKMLGDLRVLNTGSELLLLTERVALQPLFDALRRGAIGWQAELHKRTLQQALFSVIGPQARSVTGDVDAVEHANRRIELGGAAVLLVATDLGVDVVCAAEDAERVRRALVEAGAVEVDEAAAEIVRVESGRPRYGVDLDDGTIPQEAGLNERAVSFTKGCYVGQETVARLHWRGKPNRHLRGLRFSSPVAHGATLSLGDREVGRVTSVVDSPEFGVIGLALVRREAVVGDTVAVSDGGSAVVADLPFSSG